MRKVIIFVIFLVIAFLVFLFISNVVWMDVIEKYFVDEPEIDPCLLSIYYEDCDIEEFCPFNPSNKQCQEYCRSFPDDDACTFREYCDIDPWDPACLYKTCPALGEPEVDSRCEDYCSQPTAVLNEYCYRYYCETVNPTDRTCLGEDYCDVYPNDVICACEEPLSEACREACAEEPDSQICIDTHCDRNPLVEECTTCFYTSTPGCSFSHFEGEVFTVTNVTYGYKLSTNLQTPKQTDTYGKIWIAQPGTELETNGNEEHWYVHKLPSGRYYLCTTIDKNLKLTRSLETFGKIVLSYDTEGLSFAGLSTNTKNEFYLMTEDQRALTVDLSGNYSMYGRTNSGTGQVWRLEKVTGYTPPEWGEQMMNLLVKDRRYYFQSIHQPRTMFFTPFNCKNVQDGTNYSTSFFPSSLKITNVYEADKDGNTGAVIIGYTGVNEQGYTVDFSLFMHEGFALITTPGSVNKVLIALNREDYYLSCTDMIMETYDRNHGSFLNGAPFRITEEFPVSHSGMDSCMIDVEANPDNVPPSCDNFTERGLNGTYRVYDLWSGLYLTHKNENDPKPYLMPKDEYDIDSQTFKIYSNEAGGIPPYYITLQNIKTDRYVDFEGFEKRYTTTEVRNLFTRWNISFNIGSGTSSNIYEYPAHVCHSLIDDTFVAGRSVTTFLAERVD